MSFSWLISFYCNIAKSIETGIPGIISIYNPAISSFFAGIPFAGDIMYLYWTLGGPASGFTPGSSKVQVSLKPPPKKPKTLEYGRETDIQPTRHQLPYAYIYRGPCAASSRQNVRMVAVLLYSFPAADPLGGEILEPSERRHSVLAHLSGGETGLV
ncbi:MAG: hypothetical protein H6573_27025 [Lewinellaceae bacterium]|nr:hypothetical protein [Phaeodactylibacter sp.]MCB9351128.1 hypothetical protein [Lewinellaceae bacterium]